MPGFNSRGSFCDSWEFRSTNETSPVRIILFAPSGRTSIRLCCFSVAAIVKRV
eukprot:CAMPEP_0169113128 /NCGR_PEP_ID=MMETSP1015-20121227/28027_1 /TAXON_ID=342587 /ORGANISM="Karlodinium micrum, Strain CCMP2283" /LENGTH=52 /DNA_ID=CAMNT_0009175259 /DNA_START=133 /DNA_END=291 /DNA_ORIENTATION=+